MLAVDHIPQLCITKHARLRFVQRCRWDLRAAVDHRGAPRDGNVDVELRRMIEAASWRYGVPSWKYDDLGTRRRRLQSPGWIVELIARVLPSDVGDWQVARVAVVLVCDADCWHVLTLLTGPPPRIVIDVFSAAG